LDRVVGVLALQGDFEAHGKTLAALGAAVREVRVAADLDGLDALVLPGGESTTMTLGIEREGLARPLCAACASVPVLATCAIWLRGFGPPNGIEKLSGAGSTQMFVPT